MKSRLFFLFCSLYILIGYLSLFYKGPERPELQKQNPQEQPIDVISRQSELLSVEADSISTAVDSCLFEALNVHRNSVKLLLDFKRLEN